MFNYVQAEYETKWDKESWISEKEKNKEKNIGR